MEQVWSNPGERLQYEPPLRQAGMRYHQTRFVEHQVSIKEDIKVESSRGILKASDSTLHNLDRLACCQQLGRRQVGLHFDHDVQEPGLFPKSHGLGLEVGRDPPRFCPTFPQRSESPFEMCLSISEVGSRGDISDMQVFHQNAVSGNTAETQANFGFWIADCGLPIWFFPIRNPQSKIRKCESHILGFAVYASRITVSPFPSLLVSVVLRDAPFRLKKAFGPLQIAKAPNSLECERKA